MKKLLSIAAILAVSACSLVAENPDGSNAEPAAWEQATGDIIFGAVALAVGAEVIGADVFPLNAGVFSGL